MENSPNDVDERDEHVFDFDDADFSDLSSGVSTVSENNPVVGRAQTIIPTHTSTTSFLRTGGGAKSRMTVPMFEQAQMISEHAVHDAIASDDENSIQLVEAISEIESSIKEHQAVSRQLRSDTRHALSELSQIVSSL